MSRRPLSTIVLLAAVLLSSWNNVIAAAFCPRYLSNHACSSKPISQESKQVKRKFTCHHDMSQMEKGDMQMDETEMESVADVNTSENSIPEGRLIRIGTEAFAENVVTDLSAEPCGHCWMHSQPPSATATLVAIDPSKRFVETSAPPADFVAALPSAFTIPILPLEHGPPGDPSPRHVLINIFRI